MLIHFFLKKKALKKGWIEIQLMFWKWLELCALVCWYLSELEFSDLIIILQRWHLFSHSCIPENQSCSLESWLNILVSRSNHSLFGLHLEVYMNTFCGMAHGGCGELKKILSEVGTSPTNNLDLDMLMLTPSAWNHIDWKPYLKTRFLLQNLLKQAAKTASKGLDGGVWLIQSSKWSLNSRILGQSWWSFASFFPTMNMEWGPLDQLPEYWFKHLLCTKVTSTIVH